MTFHPDYGIMISYDVLTVENEMCCRFVFIVSKEAYYVTIGCNFHGADSGNY